MKIRSYRRRVHSMLMWISAQVDSRVREHWHPSSPAGEEMARRFLAQIQAEQRSKEPMTPEWGFPILLTVDKPSGQILLRIDEEWEREHVIYLDFDSFPGPAPKT